jgi:hypothetical protein
MKTDSCPRSIHVVPWGVDDSREDKLLCETSRPSCRACDGVPEAGPRPNEEGYPESRMRLARRGRANVEPIPQEGDGHSCDVQKRNVPRQVAPHSQIRKLEAQRVLSLRSGGAARSASGESLQPRIR